MRRSFVHEIRYAARGLRRSVGFTAAIVAMLALGLGANGAALSVVARLILWEPPGVSNASRVRRVVQEFTVDLTREQRGRDAFSYPEVRAMARWAPEGARVAGYYSEHASVDTEGAPGDLVATYIAGNYFGLLGARASVGRVFGRDEYDSEALTPVVVISDALWERRFARSPDVVHRSVQIGSHQFGIVGVASPEFRGVGLEPSDLWIPYNAAGDWAHRDEQFHKAFDLRFHVLARMPSERYADIVRSRAERALAELGVIRGSASAVSLTSLARVLGPQRENGVTDLSLAAAVASAAILLIACANIAHLLMIRAMRRKREIATRAALGASRARLVRQFVIESVLLAQIAALPAFAVGVWTRAALRQTLLPNVAWAQPALDLRLALAIGVIATCVGFGVGLVPMLSLDQRDLSAGLKVIVRDESPRGSRLRAGMLVVQAGLSVVLLVGAGLFVRSFSHVRAVWGGDRADGVVFASVPLFDDRWLDQSPAVAASAADLASRLRSMPGVTQVALSNAEPVTSVMFLDTFLPGRDSVPRIPGIGTHVAVVSPGFLDAMGIRLLRGRDFGQADALGSELVVLVSSLMARTYWPGADAIGKCLIVGHRHDPCRTVIGVVADAHAMQTIEPPTMRYYLPIAQMSKDVWNAHAVVIRAAPGRTADVVAALRRAVTSGWSGGFSWHVRSLAELLEPQLRPWRLSAHLFSALGFLSLLVAGLGTYATVAYTTTQRTREIGVRRALGARSVHILRLVVPDALRLVVLGIVLGGCLAVLLAHFARSLLYEVSPYDLGALCGGALLLIGAGAVASIVPSARATAVDPTVALREE